MSQVSSAVKRLIYAGIIVFGIIADQISKVLAVLFLKPVSAVPIIKNVFHLTYVENRGAAFGMLADHRWLFMVFSTVAIVGLGFYLFWGRSYLSEKREDGTYPPITLWTGVPIAMIVSGGIGNMIDRIRLGYVVDFFDFTLINFAVFNVADSFVTVGAVLLGVALIVPMFRKKDKTKFK